MSPSRVDLQTQAEVLKLGRLLGREPDTLSYLAELPAEDVRALREQVTDRLFDAHAATLNRLAAASKLLPVGLVATLAQRAFGPVLSARITGLLEPARAVEMSERLPVDFLADLAVELDPRRASAVIAKIPPQQIAAVTRELIARGEYVTMGRFVGHLPRQSILAAVREIDNPSLLQVAFVLERKDKLGELIALLPERRISGLVADAREGRLWLQAADLLDNLDDERAAALARHATPADLDALDRARGESIGRAEAV